MAFSHRSRPLGRSSDTLNTVKPLSLYWLNAFTTFGFSARHGPHQLAQKSTNTYEPRNWKSETGRFDVSLWVKFIACRPRPVFLAVSMDSFKAIAEGHS